MFYHLRPALALLTLFTLLTGIAYPLALTGIARIAFPVGAEGSLVRQGDRVVGSTLIAQPFAAAAYLHPRPSAVDWNSAASGASNLGPTSDALIAAARERIAAFTASTGTVPPIDAVTASASGLDPDVSPTNALAQAERIAKARGIAAVEVLDLVVRTTEGRFLGLYGQPRVNVLRFNLALDVAFGEPILPGR